MLTRLRLRAPSPAMVVAIIALIVATSGSAFAAGTIIIKKSSQLGKNVVTSRQIKNSAITEGGSEIDADGRFSLGYPRKDGGDEIDATVVLHNRPLGRRRERRHAGQGRRRRRRRSRGEHRPAGGLSRGGRSG